jgi:hypothetical protein
LKITNLKITNLKITEGARIFWLFFSAGKGSHLIMTKMGWATCWAIFSPTHPVTLAWPEKNAPKNLRWSAHVHT